MDPNLNNTNPPAGGKPEDQAASPEKEAHEEPVRQDFEHDPVAEEKHKAELEGQEQAVPVSSDSQPQPLEVEKPHEDEDGNAEAYHPHKKKSALPMIITVIVVLLFGGGLFAYLFFNQPSTDTSEVGENEESILESSGNNEQSEDEDEEIIEEPTVVSENMYSSSEFGFSFDYPTHLVKQPGSVSWAKEYATFTLPIDTDCIGCDTEPKLTLAVRDFAQTYIAQQVGGETIYNRAPMEIAGMKAFRFDPTDTSRPTVYIIESTDYAVHLEIAAESDLTAEEVSSLISSFTFSTSEEGESPSPDTGT